MRKAVLAFVLGLVIGILVTVFAPPFLAPYVPGFLQRGAMAEAEVVDKGWDGKRLLVTLRAEEGVTLATFNSKAPKIDLLVRPGDLVTLDLDQYQPFVEDPEIARVRQQDQSPATADQGEPAAMAEAGPEVESDPVPEDDIASEAVAASVEEEPETEAPSMDEED
jgi:hypothetical protein